MGERDGETSIEADFFAVSQPDLLSLYSDLQQQHKEKCLMVAMLAAAGLGRLRTMNLLALELMAINPAPAESGIIHHRDAFILATFTKPY